MTVLNQHDKKHSFMFLKKCVKIPNSDIEVGLHKTFPLIWSVKYKQSKETKLPLYYKLYCVCV